MKGKFIAIEGGDGAGKDTQIDLLRKELGEKNIVYTREPGGTELGKVLREMVLHETYGSLPLLTEVFLFLADRAQHIAEVVEPALAQGKVVISNRSWVSMMAYQIYGRDRHDLKSLVEDAIKVIYRDTPFDLVVVLDLDEGVGVARQKAAGKQFDVMESMSLKARAQVRKGFLELAKELSVAKVIDASRSIEEVYQDIKGAVEGVIQNKP